MHDPNRPKCLLITNVFPPIYGGSAVVYEGICRFSPAGSMTVLTACRHYVTGEILNGWREHDANAPYPVHRLDLLRPLVVNPRSRLHSLWLLLTVDLPLKLKVWRMAMRIIRKQHIDLVCIGDLNSLSWLGLACRRWLGVKIINYIHGEEVTVDLHRDYYHRCRRRYLQQADAVVAVSGFTRQALIERMGVAPANIELICNGIDVDRFQPGPKNAALAARYGLQGKQIILTVGRLIERKGIDMTLRALPQVLARYPVHYLIVGTGPYRPALEELTRTLGLEQHVTFTGPVDNDELVAHYQLCDMFVMPNRELADHDTEGFGLVFLEANACGKAVIGGRAGGAVEAVREGENGLLVDGHNPADIAAAMLRLLDDSALRRRLEQRGLAIARASSLESSARRFYALCLRLLADNPA